VILRDDEIGKWNAAGWDENAVQMVL